MDVTAEQALRERIMDRLSEAVARNGGEISRAELTAFPVSPGETRRLIDASKGIWNPRDLQATLTVLSSTDGPYEDREVEGGLLRYDYRRGSSDSDNRKLRRACELKLPIILLRKITKGVFQPVFPVFVVADDAEARQFVLALEEGLRFLADPLNPSESERRYAQQVVRRRLHQPEFRIRVMRAYGARCAVCSLQYRALLDAAHIVGDRDEFGEPITSNGVCLCKLHHAAYDNYLLAIAPDYTIHISASVRNDLAGGIVDHALKNMHGGTISVPRRTADRPDPTRLAVRFAHFRDRELAA